MCYARKSVTRTKATEYPNLMTSTRGENEPKRKAYANAYAKTKEIISKLLHTRGTHEHVRVI